MSPSDGDVTEPGAEDTEAEKTAPAERRNTVLIASVAAVVVLVVAGVIVYLLTSGDDSDDQAGQGQDVPTITGSPAPTTPDPDSPSATVAPPATATGATGAPPEAPEEIQGLKSVAEQAATAISSADVTTLNELSCEPVGSDAEDTFPTDAKAEVVGEPKISGDTATIDLKLTIGESETTTVPMPLVKKDGRWCIPS